MAADSSAASGSTPESKNCTTLPSLPMRNLQKFHPTSPALSNSAYKGWGEPDLIVTLSNIGKVTLYVLEQKVYRCPAHPFQTFDRHFSWNDMINGAEYGIAWNRISMVTLPTKTMALLDDIDPRGAGWLVGNWLLSLGTPYRYIDPVAAWHDQGMNLNFMDGHAEYWKWQDPRTWGMVTESSLNNMSAFFHNHPGSVDWLRLRRAVNPGSTSSPPP